jgi:hypothetical protein
VQDSWTLWDVHYQADEVLMVRSGQVRWGLAGFGRVWCGGAWYGKGTEYITNTRGKQPGEVR